MMRSFLAASMVAAGLVLIAAPGVAAPCDVQILKVESRLQRVLDPGLRQAIESLLDQAKRALTLREPDRCMADVNKAKHALRMK
ncbi:MAG TPA: hypothetical protein VEK12_12300 [Alphaproteobacteria bacterium]|nr:hypothetical protein [Alphaproteobacteria bacterium]